MKQQPPHIITDSSVTVIINGNPLTMNSDNANYNNVIEALADGRYECLEDIDFALVELEKLNLVEKFTENGKEMWKLIKS